MANLIIGCGYLGERLGANWLREGKDVFATTRSQTRFGVLASRGFHPIICDVTNPPAELPNVETVVWSVGFDRGVYRDISDVYVDGLRNMLGLLIDRCQRFIYISSTGVYSQTAGQEVNEESECQPETDGGRACLVAEKLIANHRLGDKAIYLRLAGIYGPDRVPRIADLRDGIPIKVNPDSYLNLIHVEDAVTVISAAARSLDAPETYLVSDGQPTLRRDYYNHIAGIISAPTPTFEPPAASPKKTQRGSSSKRIQNSKMLKRLRVKLKYANYREGLAELL